MGLTKHRRALEDIAQNPHKIGIESSVTHVFIERGFYRGGSLYVEPDVLFYLDCGIYIPVEYKCNNEYSEKAKQQLIRSKEVLMEQLGCIDPVMVYVYGNEPYSVRQLYELNGKLNWEIVQ